MKILAISGSASQKSSNTLLLNAIQSEFANTHEITVYEKLRELPLFRPEDHSTSTPREIDSLRNLIKEADAIIFSTPEYTHNIPAVVKNMLEWFTASGEFSQKKVLPITFTPHEPRGEYAMKSLLFSLKAMDAEVTAQLPLYKADIEIIDGNLILNEDYILMLSEALKMF